MKNLGKETSKFLNYLDLSLWRLMRLEMRQ